MQWLTIYSDIMIFFLLNHLVLVLETPLKMFCYVLLTRSLRQLMVESLLVLCNLVKAFDCVNHEMLLTCHMVSGEMLLRLYSRPNAIFNPCMLMIFLLPLLMLMSIFMLMIQNYIFVITTSDNWCCYTVFYMANN